MATTVGNTTPSDRWLPSEAAAYHLARLHDAKQELSSAKPLPPDPEEFRRNLHVVEQVDTESTPSAKVLPWIQNQPVPPSKQLEHSDGDLNMSEPFGLVSAADMHNREINQPRGNQSPHDGQARQTVNIGFAPAKAVERESWMDAQSVERARLEEEYERESRRGSAGTLKASSPGKDAVEADLANSVNGAHREKETVKRNASDERARGDEPDVKSSRSKSKARDGKHKHRHRHHHADQRHHRSEGESLQGGSKAKKDDTSSSPQHQTKSHSNSVEREGNVAPENNRGPSKPQDAHLWLEGGPTPLLPQPEVDGAGFPPMYPPPPAGPWYATQTETAPFPPQPPFMPAQGLAWGRQAQQAFTASPEGRTLQQDFETPRAPFGFSPAGPFPRPPSGRNETYFNQAAEMNTPPIQGPRFVPAEYSPRTQPSAMRYLFPPFGFPDGEASQGWGGPVHAGSSANQWQSPPTPPVFGGMPYGPFIPPQGMPMTAEPLDIPKLSTEDAKVPPPQHRDERKDATSDNEETLESLRERMRRNAEESRIALEREREGRKTSEQRLEALERLADQRSGKGKKAARSVSKSNGISKDDAAPTYVETSEGFIKTYDKVQIVRDNDNIDGSTQVSDAGSVQSQSRQKDHPRQSTQQTLKTSETRPTSTSGPSFGHFSRPFSHQIDGLEQMLHASSPFDKFPVDPARIVIMQRTVAAKPGFGIPVSALGEFGLGFGAFSPLEDSLDPMDFGRDDGSVKRSAYVETVSDEDDPKISAHSARRNQESSREHIFGTDENDVVRLAEKDPGYSGGRHKKESHPEFTSTASNVSLQGSPVFSQRSSDADGVSRATGNIPRRNPDRFSQALTTASLVDHLVQGSHYHDETLCQLLTAARNPKLGDAAKKAVRHAARNRVMQLMSDTDKAEPSETSNSTIKGKDKPLPKQPLAEEEAAPAWSQALFEMMAETQTRLNELDARLPHLASRENTDTLGAEDEFAEAQARAALHNLLFPDLPMEVPFFVDQYGNPHTSHHLGSSRNHPFDLRSTAGRGFTTDTAGGARIETAFTDARETEGTIRASGNGAGERLPEWGSAVDIPDGESTVPPPTFSPVVPPKGVQSMPTIHVQPPTTTTAPSNVESQGRHTLVSPGTHHEQTNALHDVTTAEIRKARSKMGEALQSGDKTGHQRGADHPQEQMKHVPIVSNGLRGRPWDIVSQRLLSWALVWPAEDFIRSLHAIALGQQADEFALTIYTMTIFKRNLRHRLSAVPPLPCDKLFVPPNMSDAINRAVHAKRFNDAQQILEELWYPFGFQDPPRVIVALAKHRNDPDHWSAHRFDLPTGRLVTMTFSHEEKSLIDGRPFMWWHCIRQAWPQFHIPHPDHLAQQTRRVVTTKSANHENSLAATNAARNLLLGWKPERSTDMHKLRELVWQEVKRLHTKKVAGKLILDQNGTGRLPDDY